MSIPLVQDNNKDSINTSIIAIKRNIERINMLLGLVDSGSDPDLSGLATKQELQDAVTDLSPVDEVTSGNMHSVTSNAVAQAIENKKTFSSTSFGTQLTIHRDANGGSADIKYSNKGSVLGFMGIGPDAMPEFIDKNESIVRRIPYIDYTNIDGTTDNNGLLDLGNIGNYIPLIVYNNYPYITQFFNGSGGWYHPYVRITNYDGTPIANTQVTLRLIVLPL